MDGHEPQDEGGADGAVIALPAILDLTNAQEIKSRLEAALAQSSSLILDASAVQRVTSPCLQVLVSAKRSFAQAGGAGIRFQDPSPAFLEAARMLELSPILALPGE